jgi:vitamin B12 transporter
LKGFNSSRAVTLAILGIAISSSLSAHADETQTLDTILVTANRSEVAANKTLASVTVITRADIEKSQAPDVADLLSQQAGLDIVRSGGSGTNVSVFTRGSNSNHTLILINGVRVNTAVQGSYDFSSLPLALIDRVEIVRGPRAALWGSDAIGGVIQIFTREKGSFAEFRAGSYGRAEFDAGFGLGDEENNFGASFGYGSADGFSATNSNVSFGFDPDNDGYENSHVLLNGKMTVGSHTLSAFASAVDANIEFDQGESDKKNREVGLILKGELTDIWQHSLSLSHSYENLETPVYGSIFGSRRLAVDWVNSIAANEQNHFNVGVNWSDENGSSEDFGLISIDQNRRNTGLFASWRGEFASNTFELAARRDDNSQFGGKTTAQAAWGFEINEDLRLRASWGQGFRAPNFNELYYPGFFGFFAGKADLRPESSDSAELGLSFDITSQQSLEVSAYRTNVKDLIAFEGVNFQADNIDRARLKGAEVEYQFKGEVFSLSANAGWQDARNLDDNQKLLRRADRKLNINADFKINQQWSLGLDLQAASERPDFGDPAAGYGRVDGRVSYQFANAWSLEARIENLGDKDYELIPGYNTPGRSGLITLRWNEKN